MLRITQANINLQTHNRTAWRYGTVLQRRTYNHASTPAAHRLHGTNPPIISSYPIQPSTHKLAHSPALPFTPFTLVSSPFHSTSLIRHGRHRPGHHDHDHEHEEEDEEDQVQTPITPEDKLKMQKECTDITMRGVYWNITLSIFKFIGGVMGNSMAMIADAVHSLSDLVTDGITLWAARLTHKPQDADHPYGHGKFEAIGSLTISATLAATAGGIGWSAIESIQTIMAGENLSVPTGIALVAAVISIAVKEMLYHQTLKVGNRWNSKVVKANAWHHRSDSVSTLVAMVGVIGGMIHVPILDPIAGLFVSGLIMKAAVELGWDSLRDLTDENVDEKIQSDVSAILRSMHDEGVLSFHRLRGRAMGPFVLMDVHISVSPFISVSAAHQIAERARIRVRQKLPVISELLVHVDVAAHEHTHRLFEDAEYSGADCCDHNHGHHNGNVLVIGPSHISKIVDEYQSSRAEAAALVSSTKKSSAPSSTSSDSSKAAPSSATSLFQSIIDHTSEPAKSTGESSTPATVEATDDLSQLMRPQSLIERDVRLVLGDQSASYATLLKGVSHFTCHWNPSTQQLRVQLELAFHSDTLTIRQASQVAKSIEASILARIPDVHAVDIHLELTDAHIREAKKVEPTRELPPNTNGETNAN